MNINDISRVGVYPLMPQGMNSTMFTECCRVAICDDQARCPRCKKEVIGADTETDHERDMIRWKYATQHWTQRGSR